MTEPQDIIRLRQEYQRRSERFADQDIYSHMNPSNLFMVQGRQRAVLRLLKKYKVHTLNNQRIIEIGCGSGGVIAEYLTWGAAPNNLYGFDLLFNRLRDASNILPHLSWICANGQNIPYKSGAFDIALQYTAFSSILDDDIKRQVAAEMVRVLKPGGIIIWYDFWLNPTNRQTKGIRKQELLSLFPKCVLEFNKITLAPPIVRRIVPVSWGFAYFLETVKFLNTHYLVVIRQETKSDAE
jgi:ubiquinone/menaquinone biosynthesis C-methylase UbiE